MLHAFRDVFHTVSAIVDFDAATQWFAPRPSGIFPNHYRFRFAAWPTQVQFFSGEVFVGAVPNHTPDLPEYSRVCYGDGPVCLRWKECCPPRAPIVSHHVGSLRSIGQPKEAHWHRLPNDVSTPFCGDPWGSGLFCPPKNSTHGRRVDNRPRKIDLVGLV